MSSLSRYLQSIILYKEGEEALASFLTQDKEDMHGRNLTRQELIQIMRCQEQGIAVDLINPARFAEFIQHDPPVIIASLLFCLPGDYAQSVLRYFPAKVKQDIQSCLRGKINFALAEWLKLKLQNFVACGEHMSNEQ